MKQRILGCKSEWGLSQSVAGREERRCQAVHQGSNCDFLPIIREVVNISEMFTQCSLSVAFGLLKYNLAFYMNSFDEHIYFTQTACLNIA